jgi:hypothetical protein
MNVYVLRIAAGIRLFEIIGIFESLEAAQKAGDPMLVWESYPAPIVSWSAKYPHDIHSRMIIQEWKIGAVSPFFQQETKG